jgi:hypothetical protein
LSFARVVLRQYPQEVRHNIVEQLGLLHGGGMPLKPCFSAPVYEMSAKYTVPMVWGHIRFIARTF